MLTRDKELLRVKTTAFNYVALKGQTSHFFDLICVLNLHDLMIKNLSWGQHWSILTFDISTAQELYMTEISSWIFRNMARFFIFMVRLYLNYVY
jgi:hypothetical protein